ncbi:branched-chain amino acid transport system II carrier protein [Metabacillus sp. KIGAM252]|uniref:Branched-chain amino acid transport system carrier protein n=2 Tax=Metabacillus flavus TaxID=2823519 RepID=A0ABS5LIA1_9BACI|nr:branched-chain amino acid transport system II carrier protein [Metabacillus flavus]
MDKLSRKDQVLISVMLFSMFFGAGNLIFPTFLGYSAGTHTLLSLAGFVATAVGLPVMVVIAIAIHGTAENLNEKVHPYFALIFPIVIYLCIGPGLAIPRAATIAYEMGMKPFIQTGTAAQPMALGLYTLVFFGLVLWLSLSPSKLIDRLGKVLAPITLTIISVLFIRNLFTPQAPFGAPKKIYQDNSFFQGFLDGYLTMDALGAMAFGVLITNTVRARGMKTERQVSRSMITVGIGAGILLTVVYSILAYLGASSAGYGKAANGAGVLTLLTSNLFGDSGVIILGVLFTLACLSVSIGLVIACSQYFYKLLPSISYRMWTGIFTLASMLIANLGLDQILSISVPILSMIYPILVVLVTIGLMEKIFKNHQPVYYMAVLFTGIYSAAEFLNTSLLKGSLDSMISAVPLSAQGIGWLLPAFAGAAAGYAISSFRKNKVPAEQ